MEALARANGQKRSLVLVGFMGAGKSQAAKRAASSLGLDCIDSDSELERELEESIASFFDREGEQAFRRREQELVVGLLRRSHGEVIALGGGAIESESVRAAASEHVVCYLEVDAQTAWQRASAGTRPLARDWEAFKRLHARRQPLYEDLADAIVPANKTSFAKALPALGVLMGSSIDRLRLIFAHAASGDYPVFIGSGLCAAGFFYPPQARRYVVCDQAVDALYSVDGAFSKSVIEPGEGQKTLGQAESILRSMARAGVSSDDVVVALGGGVVGDLAGFCAATYQRGIGVVQVPTTLVAQVDSAYGGKTAVDLPEAKNYVGAYHQPASVLVDPSTLASLPRSELNAGFAEVVKTALIAGGRLWDRVRAGAVCDEQTITDCARTKLAVVASDERDRGGRQVLNLGHTVAHALETATGYRRYRHGEAVAIGLLCALRLSGQSELRAEVCDLLRRQGLPLAIEGVSCAAIVDLVARDKKRRGGEVGFVLVCAPGSVTTGHAVSQSELKAALEEVCE